MHCNYRVMGLSSCYDSDKLLGDADVIFRANNFMHYPVANYQLAKREVKKNNCHLILASFNLKFEERVPGMKKNADLRNGGNLWGRLNPLPRMPDVLAH